MKSKRLIQYLEQIDDISSDTEIKLFVNDNVYNVGYTRSDGMIFGVNRNSLKDTADNTDKSKEQLLKNSINKIKEIVDEWHSDTWTDGLSYECMIKIAELVEPQESEEEQPKQTDGSCLDFNLDRVKEFLKRDDFDDLIVDHTCED